MHIPFIAIRHVRENQKRSDVIGTAANIFFDATTNSCEIDASARRAFFSNADICHGNIIHYLFYMYTPILRSDLLQKQRESRSERVIVAPAFPAVLSASSYALFY